MTFSSRLPSRGLLISARHGRDVGLEDGHDVLPAHALLDDAHVLAARALGEVGDVDEQRLQAVERVLDGRVARARRLAAEHDVAVEELLRAAALVGDGAGPVAGARVAYGAHEYLRLLQV